VVIVSSPQDLAFMVVKKTIKMTQKMNIPILGLVENMSYAVCPHCHEKLEIFGASQGEKASREAGIDFLGNLPWDTRLNELVDTGKVEEYESPEVKQIIERMLAKLD